MPGDSPQSPPQRAQLLASVIDRLACPVCLAALQIDVATLLCTGCGRQYPIVDGIPVLIPTPISPPD